MSVRGTFLFLTMMIVLITASPAARADYASAIAAFEEGDYATALAEFTPLGQRGDPRAQFRLGEMYFNGFGVEVDHHESHRWYLRASENGHAPAQLRLGSMIALGMGTDISAADAYYWIALSVLWTDGDLRRVALQGLGDVATHLTPEEKTAIEKQARRAWE